MFSQEEIVYHLLLTIMGLSLGKLLSLLLDKRIHTEWGLLKKV